jgi:hypothetical protein
VCAQCKDALVPAKDSGPGPHGYVLHRPDIAPRAETCAWCSQDVYEAERVRAFSGVYHVMCLKCAACGARLSVDVAHPLRDKPHCLPCFRAHTAGSPRPPPPAETAPAGPIKADEPLPLTGNPEPFLRVV